MRVIDIKVFFVFLFLIFQTLPAFGAGADSVPRITPLELNIMLDRGVDVLILDVSGSLSQKVIRGAVRKALGELYRGEGLPMDKEKQIVTYCTCLNEETSASIALMLMKKGYTRVSALKGGFDAWVKAGYPLEGQ